MRLTGLQQLIGDGIVACLIVQRLEAKLSGAPPHKRVESHLGHLGENRQNWNQLQHIYRDGLSTPPFRHKLGSTSMANLNWQNDQCNQLRILVTYRV
jgi:hypothetical protein